MNNRIRVTLQKLFEAYPDNFSDMALNMRKNICEGKLPGITVEMFDKEYSSFFNEESENIPLETLTLFIEAEDAVSSFSELLNETENIETVSDSKICKLMLERSENISKNEHIYSSLNEMLLGEEK